MPPKIERVPLSAIIHDPQNANRGTARGAAALRDSIASFGFVEPGVLDRDRTLINGDKRTNTAASLDMSEAIIVHHDGHTPIYIQLDDFDLDSPDPALRSRSRELSVILNRLAELNLAWDAAMLESYDIDLSHLFLPEELADLRNADSKSDDDVDFDEFDSSSNVEIRYRVVVDNLSRFDADTLASTLSNSRVEQYRL